MVAGLGIVARGAFYGDGLADRRQIAGQLRNATRHHATRAIHAVHFGVLADAHGGVAVASRPGVIVKTRYDAGRVAITIQDFGNGIGPDDMVHIFDPYFTTRRKGTGLGLPIAKNIIEGLGGAITVTSRIGEGTQIRLDLPLTAEAIA